MRISDDLKRARGNMGIRACAGEIGVSPTTLTRIESGGEPDTKTLRKIVDWMGADISQYVAMPVDRKLGKIKVSPDSILRANAEFNINSIFHL